MMRKSAKQVQTRGINIEDLFDETPGYEDETGVRFAPGLTEAQRKQAVTLYRLFNELWGLCLVMGMPGTGKDAFGNYLAYTINRYFPWKRVIRDEKPRKLFGEYAGLFNEQVLREDLARMREVAKGKSATEIGKVLEKAADEWVTNKGSVMLKNSILYLTEFWRYCYNREPMNPMNKTMGGIHKMKRHIDVLILGTVQLETDLDKRTCLPFADWKVICTRSVKNKTGFTWWVQRVKWDPRYEILAGIGDSYPISVDMGSPRSFLGDGKIILLKPKYRPVTDEERIILDVIKAGFDTYESIVKLIEDKGDMDETEILDTLKELKFRRYKRAIDYPCYFGLYNSKSAPQMKTTVKMED